MARRRRQRLPQKAVELVINGLSHEGRGIAQLEGKTVFCANALPGEAVSAKIVHRHSKYDEANAQDVLKGSSELRSIPPCQHSEICGGCALQHMHLTAQIEHKQKVLLEQLKHFGAIVPQHVLPPLLDLTDGYRNKARLGVRWVEDKGGIQVGFREKSSNFIVDVQSCSVLHPQIASQLTALRMLITQLSIPKQIPQIEVAAGDESLAIVIRHLSEFSETDIAMLKSYAQSNKLHIYLQPKSLASVHKLWPEDGLDRLFYSLPEQNLTLAFHPLDFTQVNPSINRKMINQALALLDLQPEDEVLDLFCGLGNFSLPMAAQAKSVTGVEGSNAMVDRGYENAKSNGLSNVRFFSADLEKPIEQEQWTSNAYNKVLLDPPRSGALNIVNNIQLLAPQRIVYVSCNPATLARDAGILNVAGYTLKSAGVMDMFPHTAHVESIAWFERER